MATLLLFILGASLGTVLDHMHVAGGATSYAHPFLWDQAWFVPPLFGFAAAGFGDLHQRLRRLLLSTAPTRERVWIDGVLFVGAYAVSAFVKMDHAVMALVFVGAWAVRWWLTGHNQLSLVHGLACAALGVGTETQLVRLGLFTHHQADLAGVPYWLAGL
ncbi:MAG: hypothetical protein JST92_23375, partial [Deltaproteobacteria bacterium]|nr:hypothetical protein [Deltaproteobacteria bacterium]